MSGMTVNGKVILYKIHIQKHVFIGVRDQFRAKEGSRMDGFTSRLPPL